jgi:hypothetical protein
MSKQGYIYLKMPAEKLIFLMCPERMALAFIGASCRKVLDELKLKLDSNG